MFGSTSESLLHALETLIFYVHLELARVTIELLPMRAFKINNRARSHGKNNWHMESQAGELDTKKQTTGFMHKTFLVEQRGSSGKQLDSKVAKTQKSV
jgi:hypothetical protein